jgi:hydrogenase-4 component E
MHWAIDVILVLILATNFLALGTTRVRAAVRAAGLQGALLGSLPPLLHGHLDARLLAIAIGASVLKGLVIPSVLLRILRTATMFREIDPYVGYVPSLFLCAAGTGLALLFAGNLPLVPEHAGTLLVPTSLATMLAGFLLLTMRRKALTQVVGYLFFENGIFVFGLLLIEAMPFLVEIGALLDLLVGVFVMGIVLGHIQQHFSSLDTQHLSNLKD